MKKTLLKKYAQLIVRSGMHVQKGQQVLIRAGLDQPEFVAMVVEEAYQAGAARVRVEWEYQPLTRLHSQYQSVETLAEVTRWEIEKQKYYCEVFPCTLYLDSQDPDGLKGVRTDKLAQARQLRYPILKPYSDARENREQWCIAAVPGEAWAKKMFPELSPCQAVEKLWEAILYTCRVTEDPVAAWEAHNRDLKQRCAYLNDLHIASLHYTADNGTDLTVGLIPEGRFCGGEDTTLQGVSFNPNLPTEECFTSPMRGKAEGIVYATKPLSYEGQLIENFYIRFHEGRAVESGAEKGAELLKTMLSMDEGAAYLGECALVPERSPIAESGLLFYNTLFDENAACHLAVGMGFADCIRGFESRSLEECRALGINDSMIHVDFMIGCAGMHIDAVTADGRTVPVFDRGNWAF